MTLKTYAYSHGKGHLAIDAKAAGTTELLVYGYIGESWWDQSVSARNVAQELSSVTSGEVLVRINSPGGSVADGVAIFNTLRGLAAKGVTIKTRNEGNAASIAGLILMAGDTAQSYANAVFMIHAPYAYTGGNAEDLRNAADYLDKLTEAVATSYAHKTGKGEAHALALLKNGKDNFFTAAEALAEGFLDEIIDPLPDAPAAQASLRVDLQAMAAIFPDLHQPSAAAFASLLPNTPNAAPRGLNPELSMPNPTAAAPTPANPSPAPAAQSPAAPDAMAVERARKTGIVQMFAALGDARAAHAGLEAQCLADEAVTAEAAGQKLLAAMAASAKPTPTGNPRVEITADERDHFRAGMANALMHRANPGLHKLDERGQRYNGMNLVRMAEEACRVAGLRTGYAPGEIAAKALHSTSDFPLILENVITKSLRNAYESTRRTFLPFTRRAVLPDFKQVSRTQMGGAPDLKRVVEGAEYEAGTIGEGAEKYAVQKYGRIVGITWETIINDDLGAFTRLPEMFGRSAADLESDIVWGILNANAALSDSVALFHATHGNLGTGGAISDTTLSEARKLMRLQKGIEGRYISVNPEFLLVPPSQETAALKALSSVLAAQTSNVNVFASALQPIVEPRLEASSSTAWYLAANPAAIDTIEYAYLQGFEGVFTETKAGFEMDGMQVKCRHVFGAKAIDFRGLFKNNGA